MHRHVARDTDRRREVVTAVATVVANFRDALPAAEIYVYDNNSTDATIAVAHEAGAVVRTERITPARIPALAEVEAKVKEAWQNDERRTLADAKVKEAVEKANAGTDMATIAKDLGLELRTANAVTRFDADTGNYLTQPAAQELFKLPVGKVVSVRSAQGSVILRANEIIPVDLAKEKEPLDRFGKQLDITIGNDLIAQLLAGLRQKYGVSINEAAFTAAFQSQQPQQ